ncbi:MAG: glycosyltransferase family 4 protein [Xanthobacteraceae bacterium]
MNQIADLARVPRQRRRALRVAILGIRGFPNVQGGAEKHVENLASALAALGCEVEAIVRSGYVAKGKYATWRGVKISRLWAPRISGVEAFVHTFLGVLSTAASRPDILHIHAIGPAFFTPLARALGLRVVVTCHSRNYEHKKWGRFARSVLRLGERAGMKFANGRIAVSDGLARNLSQTYRVPVCTIPNGIDPPRHLAVTDILRAFGLVPNRYVLMVARIDDDKRQLDLIAAYARLRLPDWKLALVGGADYSGPYAHDVAKAARQNPGVVLLGHQNGAALAELYTHAGCFVLPSRFEGQPIAVLEAASYGLPLVLSDIAAHREIGIPRARYFAVGDIAALAAHLEEFCSAPSSKKLAADQCAHLVACHDWHAIAQRTLVVYCDALSGSKRAGFGGDPPAAKIRELP